jgi:hypothetical protein
VSAQLIEAATGRHVWAERYDRALDDLFAAQDEVTQAIVAAVAPTGGALERARARPPCCSTGAWELYQRGLWHAYSYDRDDLAAAVELFERAIATDARFAPAHAGLAYALYAQVLWGHVSPPRPHLERARTAATRAVALDRATPSRTSRSRACFRPPARSPCHWRIRARGRAQSASPSRTARAVRAGLRRRPRRWKPPARFGFPLTR